MGRPGLLLSENVQDYILKLTNIPGVSYGLPRTPAGAREALQRYEQQNADLEPKTRHLLGIAAIAPVFKRKVMEQAFGELPRYPFRDYAWRYWNALSLSGLGDCWLDFKTIVEKEGLRKAGQWLRKMATADQYFLFLRRIGTNMHNGWRSPGRKRQILWTKGGCWDLRSNLTKILVQKQHLPPRLLVRIWQRHLGHRGVQLIERDLMTLIDPDVMLVHEAKQLALDYTARRIAEVLGWTKRKVGTESLVWFFQMRLPYKAGSIDIGMRPVRGGRLRYVHRKEGRTALYYTW